jgi:hypothetical protein
MADECPGQQIFEFCRLVLNQQQHQAFIAAAIRDGTMIRVPGRPTE